jgi:hypothetical protein
MRIWRRSPKRDRPTLARARLLAGSGPAPHHAGEGTGTDRATETKTGQLVELGSQDPGCRSSRMGGARQAEITHLVV